MDQRIIELTLLLIHLTGWEEVDNRGAKEKKAFRAFIGYRLEALDELQNRGLIRQIPGGKSLTVTDRGKQEAKEIKKKVYDLLK
jgi:ribosomal protein S19E (S16A)